MSSSRYKELMIAFCNQAYAYFASPANNFFSRHGEICLGSYIKRPAFPQAAWRMHLRDIKFENRHCIREFGLFELYGK